jgi:2-haloalkanoic acid dehalogenase type II
MKPFEVILFDLGDTLMYFNGDWQEVFSRALQVMERSLRSSGIPVDEEFTTRFWERMQAYYKERDTEFIEYTMHYVLRTLLDESGFQQTSDEFLKTALAKLHGVTQKHWIPEEDGLATLQALRERGFRLAAISNASDDQNTQDLVDKLGGRPYFEMILSSAGVGIRKPNPKIFQLALEKMNAAPNAAAMVGDTLGADILGARNAGIYSIWLTRRANTPANRAHVDTIFPDARIHDLTDLIPLLEGMSKS